MRSSALIILLLSVVAPSVETSSNSTCRNVVYNIQKVESMHQVGLFVSNHVQFTRKKTHL